MGLSFDNVQVVRRDQLDRIPEGPPLPRTAATTPTRPVSTGAAPARWPEGALLRADGDTRVYLIEAGRRRWVPDEPTFRSRGFRFENVRVISQRELTEIPEGPALRSVRG